MDRKEFLKTVGGSCLALTGLTSLFSGCAAVYSVNTSVADNNMLTLAKKEFVWIKKGEEQLRDLVLVRTAGLAFPIAVFRNAGEKYTALWMECTHQGCEVRTGDRYLVCPCHGSEYDAKGNVLNGPAEDNLRTFKITTDNENIYIHL